MRDEFLAFGSPPIQEPEIAGIVATLRSGWIGTSPRVRARRHGLLLVEAAAHAIESAHRRRKIGTIGDLTYCNLLTTEGG